eukprot:g9623.t1
MFPPTLLRHARCLQSHWLWAILAWILVILCNRAWAIDMELRLVQPLPRWAQDADLFPWTPPLVHMLAGGPAESADDALTDSIQDERAIWSKSYGDAVKKRLTSALKSEEGLLTWLGQNEQSGPFGYVPSISLARANPSGQVTVSCVGSAYAMSQFFSLNFTNLREEFDKRRRRWWVENMERNEDRPVSQDAQLVATTPPAPVSSFSKKQEGKWILNKGEGLKGKKTPIPSWWPDQTGNPGSTIEELRVNAYKEAFRILGEKLCLRKAVIIRASFTDMGCSAEKAVLGAASPANFSLFTMGPDSVWLPAALAVQKSDRAAFGSQYHIVTKFNAALDRGDRNCMSGKTWWYGLTGSPPFWTFPFLTTITHEVAHGLGIYSVLEPDGSYSMKQPSMFDRFVYSAKYKKHWTELSVSQRREALVNEETNVWRNPTNVWRNPVGYRPSYTELNFDNGCITLQTGQLKHEQLNHYDLLLHTPNPYQKGSSISHISKAVKPVMIMEPYVEGDFPYNSYTINPHCDGNGNDALISMLADIGYEAVNPVCCLSPQLNCSTNSPCMHGGKCVPTNAPRVYRFQEGVGWSWISVEPSLTCNCAGTGYWGLTCETPLSLCEAMPYVSTSSVVNLPSTPSTNSPPLSYLLSPSFFQYITRYFTSGARGHILLVAVAGLLLCSLLCAMLRSHFRTSCWNSTPGPAGAPQQSGQAGPADIADSYSWHGPLGVVPDFADSTASCHDPLDRYREALLAEHDADSSQSEAQAASETPL